MPFLTSSNTKHHRGVFYLAAHNLPLRLINSKVAGHSADNSAVSNTLAASAGPARGNEEENLHRDGDSIRTLYPICLAKSHDVGNSKTQISAH
jgi:hypothetical protein